MSDLSKVSDKYQLFEQLMTLSHVSIYFNTIATCESKSVADDTCLEYFICAYNFFHMCI